jgi:hypothetical protein
VRLWSEGYIRVGAFTVTTKAKVTEGGAADTQGGDRTLGESSEEVEIFEEPGRLVVAIARKAGERAPARIPSEEGPILGLGKNPGRTGAGDGSAEHDRYIYTVIDREAGAFLNTGYLVAIENAEDDNHPTAREHFDGFGRMSMVTTTSYILDEVVTFFNVRGQHAKVVEVEEWLHGSPSVGMVHVGGPAEAGLRPAARRTRQGVLLDRLRLLRVDARTRDLCDVRLRQEFRAGRVRKGAIRKMTYRSAS